MKPDPQHWPQHDRPEIKLGEVLTADENAGESGNSEPLQQDALTIRNTQRGAIFVYIPSKSHYAYVCIGLQVLKYKKHEEPLDTAEKGTNGGVGFYQKKRKLQLW
jgi:hypothetical protein